MNSDFAEELKPCPFCGGKAGIIERPLRTTPDIVRTCVGCVNPACNISPHTKFVIDFFKKAELIEQWNRRKDEQ